MSKKILILAEKPSLGKSVAAWIAKSKGFSSRNVGRTHVEVGNYLVSWLFGHVLENVEPHAYDEKYKRWDKDDLPIIPSRWKLSPKREASAQIKAVKELLKKSSSVIGLGDPDQEGQLLQDEFLIWAGNKLPVDRLWLPAIDDASIARAWGAMKSNKEYEGYYWSALSRSHADWLTGINLSRACTLASQANGGNAVLSVGRVQTPTLALIVNREKEIKAFKPVDYFTPHITLATSPSFKAPWLPDKENDERLDSEGRLLDEKVAKAIAAACKASGEATVKAVSSRKGRELPPLPFSLSSLQELMSKKHGMGVQDVLTQAQSLYEKKLASYPRTDCEYLPESQAGEAESILGDIGRSSTGLKSAQSKADASVKSRAFNDKRVTAHHAIVPRPVTPAQLASLGSKELAVWTEIAKRYLLQFYPAAEFLNTEILLESAGEDFRATGKVYTIRGWRDAFSEKDDDEEEKETGSLPSVKKGEVLKLSASGVDSTTTKPPRRFTEGTLVAAMKNVHRFVTDPELKKVLRENVGIGTEATRSNVIGELFGRKFITLKRKDIHPTELGEQLIDALPLQLTAPDMTALWQQAMDDIRETGKTGYDGFIKAQSTWLGELVGEVPGWFEGKSMSVAGKRKGGVVTEKSKHPCLKCKGELLRIKGKFGWFFGCQVESCKAIFKDDKGKPVERTPQPSEKITVDGISTGDKCPKCKKGTMQTRKCGPKTKTPGKLFLSCSAFFSKGRAKCTNSLWPN